MTTNAQKLASVLAYWLEPMTGELAGVKLAGLPFLAALEAKIKHTGWVPASYSVAQDLRPIMGAVASAMIQPAVLSMLGGVPDESLPAIAHKIVDGALATGDELPLLGGVVSFSQNDLSRLKRLLVRNLPATVDDFEVVDA